ncbi:ATP-binding protein [Rhodoferax sp. U11-2br]|uniref:ATP-binding protein n=1 Tax=Rhodoferax sp. U11-2br TaxID=2838878 RepID=UPI001BEA71BB|nr:ATP-binding protein [Rhodoferax sp. U11-2br]MBT3068002.1 AAA family ATPase [Rhodoferax sp. U11-2br]
MKIQRVWAKKLHGNLTFDISLTAGINLLVGVNGSGKTSVLNIIQWITTLDIPNLAITEFDEIGLEIIGKDKKKKNVSAVQQGTNLYIKCIDSQTDYHPIHVRLRSLPRDLRNLPTRKDELANHYSSLTPEEKEAELWSLLQSISKPLTISLDRKITVNKDDYIFVEDENGRVLRKRTSRNATDPIYQVESIARQQYSQYQSQLIKLNETLKAKVISSTFAIRSGGNKVTPITLAKIDEVETKLLTRMSAWTTESNEQESVRSYFKRIRTIINNIRSTNSKQIGSMLSNFLSDDMLRVSALSDAFDEFESKAAIAYEPIQIYLRILNSFFEDSKRKLLFNDQDNQLYFQVNEDTKDTRHINVMSSGERQILILLTYIAFSPQMTSIFIIDEPELSLHPKWQHQLLPSIDELMKNRTQMIIATHSPEIVGKYVSKCIEL